MASDRQKYNFLAALLKQLDNAMDDGDDLANHFSAMVREMSNCEERSYNELVERLRELEERSDGSDQRIAELEFALEELDGDGSESSGEELESYDDGDHDDELEGVEPEVASPREGHGRLARTVGVAQGRADRRRMKTMRPVPTGKGTVASGEDTKPRTKKRSAKRS